MQPLIKEVIEGGRRFTDRVDLVIQEFFHDQYGAITDLRRPVMDMFHKSADHFLCPPDFLQVIMRIRKKLPQPFPSANGTGKVELMENRKLFLRMEDGDIGEGSVVNLHDIQKKQEPKIPRYLKNDQDTKMPNKVQEPRRQRSIKNQNPNPSKETG